MFFAIKRILPLYVKNNMFSWHITEGAVMLTKQPGLY